MPLSVACLSASDAIPKHRVRYLSITNPFATNWPLDCSISQFVRLACLSHAASVRSEPGSNPSNLFVETRPKPGLSSIERLNTLAVFYKKPKLSKTLNANRKC